MCGITGIINFKNSPREEDLRLMMKNLKHRGPDDEGVLLDGNIALGHVRLSIQDLSEAGHQPMFCNDNRYAIIFNGEIYNFIELREELKVKYNFVTNTDTEVILASYKVWGKECLNKFNGDWAFIIYDTQTKELFGARDRYGIKPFYYYKDNEKMVFASEIKAIIPMLVKKQPNDKLIYEYLLYNRTDQSEETFFEGIIKLKHGHYFTLKENRLDTFKWYDLKENLKKKKKLSFREFRDKFKEAVNIRLRSDVPVGVSLSGGIDSSSITSVVYSDLNKKDVHTFSAIYGKNEWADESNFIDTYKSTLNNMHYTSPGAKSFYNDFEDFIIAQGEPISSIGPYAQFKVMQLAKGNVTVTLDGQGADEQLAGYHYFFGSYYKELFINFKLFSLFKEIFYYVFKHKSIDAIKFMVFYLLPNSIKNILGGKIYGYINDDFAKKWERTSTLGEDLYSPKSLNESLIDHFEYKLEHLLKWDDLNAMNFSIESRVPFLDHNLVEATLPINPELKINKAETKYILREAVKDILPKEIYFRRDKKGFSTPSDDWFRTKDFEKYIKSILNSESFKNRGYFNVKKCKENYLKHLNKEINISKEIWQWINLEVWFKKFID